MSCGFEVSRPALHSVNSCDYAPATRSARAPRPARHPRPICRKSPTGPARPASLCARAASARLGAGTAPSPAAAPPAAPAGSANYSAPPALAGVSGSPVYQLVRQHRLKPVRLRPLRLPVVDRAQPPTRSSASDASWLRTGLPTDLGVVVERRGSSLGSDENRPRMANLQLDYVGPNFPRSPRASSCE